MAWVDYFFIWDKTRGEVVASYYIDRPGTKPEDVPTDVSGGPIPFGTEQEVMSKLRERYPIGRYVFAGGWASSLENAVETFLGLEHDFDDL